MTQEKTKESKANYVNLKTPKAPTVYMYLLKPDTKFNKEGNYSITIRLDPKNNPEHLAFINDVRKKSQEAFDRLIKNVKRDAKDYRLKDPFRAEYDDKENELSTVLFKASTTRPFGLWGPKASEGQLPKEALKGIWQGSTCKLAICLKEGLHAVSKTIGYSVYFDKVQFIDIVNGSNGGTQGPSKENPFGDEESTTGVPSAKAQSGSLPSETPEGAQDDPEDSGGNF